jgi:hypothetical protein
MMPQVMETDLFEPGTFLDLREERIEKIGSSGFPLLSGKSSPIEFGVLFRIRVR